MIIATLIFAFVWAWFSVTLHKLMSGVTIESFGKRLLYRILVAPSLWLEFVQNWSIRGTVGEWFARLGAWLQL